MAYTYFYTYCKYPKRTARKPDSGFLNDWLLLRYIFTGSSAGEWVV